MKELLKSCKTILCGRPIKPVENKDMTIQLIKKVTGMCREGGFSLTKSTSNSKGLLQSVREKDRRSGVEELVKDLVRNLPEDQVRII